MTSRTSADTGLTYILTALDILAEMALDRERVAELAASEIKLRQVQARAELILRFIAASRPPPNKIGRMRH